MPWGFIGNERALAALERFLASEGPPHAYLLVGPEGVGKATLALRLAQTLNCANRQSSLPAGASDGGPCGDCGQCRRVAQGIHADVLMVTVEAGETERKAISVDQVREVERAAALSPFEGRTRVIIIDPAEAMSTGAQNAFLKTLEEPPPNVVFILVVVQEGRLLETVRSRCRRIELGLVPLDRIEAALAAEGMEAERARLLTRLSRGRPGWALAAAREASILERRREVVASGRELPRQGVVQRLAMAERMAEQFGERRDSVLETLAIWREWWRDVLLVQCGAEEDVINVDRLEELRDDAASFQLDGVLTFVRALGTTRRYLEMNVQARLALDWLAMSAPKGRREGASAAGSMASPRAGAPRP